jgi:biopolymer transport protein ExbD
MKLSNRHQNQVKLELSMTSMIDVVFLLLIFFLVTTTFLRPEQQVKSAIKVIEQDAQQSRSDLEPAIVDVILQNEKVVFKLGAIRTSEIAEIRKSLEQFENKSDGAFVRVADDVPFEQAAQAIGACHASGFESVSYLPLRTQ